MNSCWISRNRQEAPLRKYSLPPSRNTRRVTVTSVKLKSTPAALRFSSSISPSVIETSAMLVGLRPRVPSVPLKMTSAISPPRNALADCSPKTHRIASEIFDLPHPLGPTTAVMPGSKFRVVLSANDLNPMAFRLLRYIQSSLCPRECGRGDNPVNGRLGQVVFHLVIHNALGLDTHRFG